MNKKVKRKTIKWITLKYLKTADVTKFEKRRQEDKELQCVILKLENNV